MKDNIKSEYSQFQEKIMQRFCINAIVSVVAVIFLYLFFWKQRGGDWVVKTLVNCFQISQEQAFLIYHYYFRSYKEIFFGIAILCVFVVLLWRLFRWMTGYFR